MGEGVLAARSARWMGEDVEARRKLMDENMLDVKNLDI
jgi:hypothetical protein